MPNCVYQCGSLWRLEKPVAFNLDCVARRINRAAGEMLNICRGHICSDFEIGYWNFTLCSEN